MNDACHVVSEDENENGNDVPFSNKTEQPLNKTINI